MVVKAKVSTKRIKREIKGLRKGLKKEVANAKKAQKKGKQTAKKVSENAKDLVLLKKELETLKKKKKRAGLSDYNRFMRLQIKKGKSFKQAAIAWGKMKREEAKKLRKRSSYNVFVSMQLKQGKTMKQAIRAWNLLKNPPKKRKRKPARKLRAKLVVRKKKNRIVRAKKVLGKPKIITRIKRVNVEKPVIVARDIFPREKVSEIIREALQGMQVSQAQTEKSTAMIFSEGKPCDEELALEMLALYFSEVARFGLKRSLSLDEVVNSYFYSLARIQRKETELKEIKGIVKKSKIGS